MWNTNISPHKHTSWNTGHRVHAYLHMNTFTHSSALKWAKYTFKVQDSSWAGIMKLLKQYQTKHTDSDYKSKKGVIT